MWMTNKYVTTPIFAAALFASCPMALADPTPPTIQNCSRPDFRQLHLSECNSGYRQNNPFLVGGGTSGGGGLIGAIRGLIHDATGL